tara:strand:- start:686 stop:1048 length:363 start_codon:yes stop_codon:yes gene_type:complete
MKKYKIYFSNIKSVLKMYTSNRWEQNNPHRSVYKFIWKYTLRFLQTNFLGMGKGRNDETNKLLKHYRTRMSKIMSETEFIKEHILPYEDDKTKVDYYEGRIDYDNEYLEEVATSKNIKLK